MGHGISISSSDKVKRQEKSLVAKLYHHWERVKHSAAVHFVSTCCTVWYCLRSTKDECRYCRGQCWQQQPKRSPPNIPGFHLANEERDRCADTLHPIASPLTGTLLYVAAFCYCESCCSSAAGAAFPREQDGHPPSACRHPPPHERSQTASICFN